jgi:hypothetical protein
VIPAAIVVMLVGLVLMLASPQPVDLERETFVLLTPCAQALFGWWRPHPASGLRAMNGLDGWTCTIFRNESAHRSSDLILWAEWFLLDAGVTIGPDGLITYVWDSKVKSRNPGYCFKLAGWRRRGRSADNRKTLLIKPREALA